MTPRSPAGGAVPPAAATSPDPSAVVAPGTTVAGTARLGPAARAFRVVHASIAVVDLAGLGYVWVCAARRRRDRLLAGSVTALVVEGVALVVGRGNCPLGPLQRSLGDPVPLFELVLPPRAAKVAVPVLAVIALLGIGLVAVRPPDGRPTRRGWCATDGTPR